MSINELVFYLFIILVPIIIYLDRKKINVESKIIFMRRTQKGKKFIESITKISKPFWNFIGFLGIILGIIAMLLVTLLIIINTYGIVSGIVESGGISLVLPGPVETDLVGAGYVLVPITIWLLIIPIIVIPHEAFHGIMCRLEKIRIKSVGWAFFLIIPAAFVEQHQKDFEKAKRISKLKVAAAGSFANIITAAIALFLIMFVMTPMLSQTGVFFETIPNSPADQAGVGGIISSIDGNEIRNSSDIISILEGKNVGDVIEIKTSEIVDRMPFNGPFFTGNEETRLLTLGEREGKPFIGIGAESQIFGFNRISETWVWIYKFIHWIFIFGLGVGLFNMLPMKPLDGGYVFEDSIRKYTKNAKKITKYVSIIVFILLLINVFGSYIF